MVAQKRGRGGKAAQAAKAKVEEPVPEPEVSEAPAADNNGDAEPEPMEQAAAEEPMEEQPEAAEAAEETESAEQEVKPEEVKEDKVEPGKLLVENLPTGFLFDYKEKLKEMFSKYGEVTKVKRGPIIVTELTTTPTLSAIVEFKNKDSLEKALAEHGAEVEGARLAVSVEAGADTAVLVGVPFEAGTEYVRRLFAVCGEIAQVQEFSKTKYKILRVTFSGREAVERALKLDRELRINGFLVTVSKYRDEDDQRQHNQSLNKNKRQSQSNNRNSTSNASVASNNGGGGGGGGGARGNNSFRGRGGGAGPPAFNSPRGGNFRGGRGRGGAFPARGGAFPRGGGFAGGMNNFMPPAYMPRPQGGYMNDGQRPNKRLRQM